MFRELIETLSAVAEQEPLGTLLERIVTDTGYRKMLSLASTPEADSRLENLDELINAATEAATRGEGPTEFLDHAALVSEADRLDSQAKVSLLTVHNAKGLEWPVVIIAGLEAGLFPHIRSKESVEGMEAERRLCYVGMTRARQQLYLSHSKSRYR